jgi:hypothetical protein
VKTIVLISLCLLGCGVLREKTLPTTSEEANQLLYYKDHRTQLCFIENDIPTSPFNTTVFSYVPCTPEVEKLIYEQNKNRATK